MAFSLQLTVEPYQSGMRIDAFLSQQLRNFMPWQFQRLQDWNAIQVDHQPVDPRRRLRTGQLVRVELLTPPEQMYDPEDYPLSIIYEDPFLVVVDKSPGVIAHPTSSMQSGTLCHFLQSHFDRQTPVKGLIRPGIVHRLDRETSGLLIIAKTHFAHRQLVDAFEHSRVSKTYVALLDGVPADTQGTIDLPIGQDHLGSKVLMSTRPEARNAKPAKTHWELLRTFGSHSLVAARPVTGRNHQIRVHFAALGHPLVGDEFYEARGRFKPSARNS
ncbi:MAG: RluA family pseudouridine synthase, partial [Planctomycetaceae bacterium]|nr:RluA family pseudouridine synthase [Planctomycetaceae bacterium]